VLEASLGAAAPHIDARLEAILGVFFSCPDVLGLSGEKKTALDGGEV